MAKVYENIHVYDGLDSEVACAPKGSTLQAGIGPAVEPFVEVGWISEDGVSEEADTSQEVKRAWQGRKIVKRFNTEADQKFSFQALEENAIVHGLKVRGAETTVTTGLATTVRDQETALDERVWRFRSIADNGTEHVSEFVGTHTLTGTVQRQANEMTIHEFEVAPIGDVTEYTDNADILAANP